jgi:hypothetical protein
VKYPHLKSFYNHGKRYHYVSRPGFPMVRIKARRQSIEFNIVYDLIMRAETVDEIKEIRKRVGMKIESKTMPEKQETEIDVWIKQLEEKYGIK